MTEYLFDPNHCTLCRKRAGLPVPDVFANDEKPTIKPRPPVLDDAEMHLICRALGFLSSNGIDVPLNHIAQLQERLRDYLYAKSEAAKNA